MQDNNLKYTSRKVQDFLAEKPAESPNCNPIENVWHKLKEYIRREVKPRTKEQLVEGIHEFWNVRSTFVTCGRLYLES